MIVPPQNSRFRLRRYFSIASGLLMLAVAMPLAYAYFYSEVREHTGLAGMRNEVLARTYANVLWPMYGEFLLSQDVGAAQRPAHESTLKLDAAFRQMSRDAPVIKIKVYNLQGVAVYSSVLREIGENKSQNIGFKSARVGSLVNELTHRGSMSATEGEIQNVDVVSSYIPIRLNGGEVTAVFELYANVTETVSRIQVVTLQLLLALLGVFLLLYLSLLAIVARADAILGRQYAALQDSEGRLRGKTSELQSEIVERQEIEQALRQSEEVAASANRAKSEFLSGMSHELRTPMNAIIGFAQLLETEPLSPLSSNQQRFVKQILKAADHLLNLINQVLDLARIESGKMPLSLEPVSLADLMDDALPMVQHLAQQHKVRSIESDCADLRVVADYGRLKQVLLNLVSNAIKYNRPDGVVRVAAAAQGDLIRIEVSDTGPGIPPDKLDDLFQPFNRLGIESADVEGTGIGLALSKRMVEAMGGAIGVQSGVGVGSTFWMTLPAAPSDLQRAAEAPGSAPSRKDRLRQDKVILYIEDNPANVMLMEEIIQRLEGLRLVCTHNAELGNAMAFQDPPDLIIMDINLPGMDGLQALQVLRGVPATAHIPVLALTANALETEVARGLAAGFDAYFTKPIQIEPFSRAMLALLAREQNGV